MKKYSTFYALVFIFIFAIITSCEKDQTGKEAEPEPLAYYVKFKVDGVEKLLTYTEGVKFISKPLTNLMVVQVRKDRNPYPLIEFTFSNGKMIFNKNLIITNKNQSDTLGYFLYNEGNNYLDEYRTLDAKAAKFGNTDLIFKLTDRTDSYVSGTFSGTAYNFKNDVKTHKIISEGKFHLKIEQ
ncbi:MAG: hypothetical protein Q8S11_15515 [Daejeonella sp.]|uniref:hypothetical protein n=1 Tax=Daejeonella sp. TaxID=2805397 RepID=UPI0027361FD6|nr:hypothetical protein [Daejeonella sp.]MDP3469749.1 hypothetical protein [Daejeonella sp.]